MPNACSIHGRPQAIEAYTYFQPLKEFSIDANWVWWAMGKKKFPIWRNRFQWILKNSFLCLRTKLS